MKQRLWRLAVVSLLIGGATCNREAQDSGKPRIAFVTNGVAAFWMIAQTGVQRAGRDFDADVSVHMPAEGISDQKRIVQDLLTMGVDGIAISPIDPANQADLINEAARSAKVVTHDSDAPDTDRLVYIGIDNYQAGRLCGQLVNEAIPDGGKIMILVGRMEQDNARRRRQGLLDEILGRPSDPDRYDPPGRVLRNEKYAIMGTLTDQFDRAKAKANAGRCHVAVSGSGSPGGLVCLQSAAHSGGGSPGGPGRGDRGGRIRRGRSDPPGYSGWSHVRNRRPGPLRLWLRVGSSSGCAGKRRSNRHSPGRISWTSRPDRSGVTASPSSGPISSPNSLPTQHNRKH